MQDIVIKMCEKLRYDRLRNDRTLADQKSDNNEKKQNNVRSAWRPVSGSKNLLQEAANNVPQAFNFSVLTNSEA